MTTKQVTDSSGKATEYDWSKSDGSAGTWHLDTATGVTSGTDKAADGSSSDIWTSTPQSDGSTVLVRTTTNADGSTLAITQVTDGSGRTTEYDWARSDGSSSDITYDSDGATTIVWTDNQGYHGTRFTGASGGAGDTFTFKLGSGSDALQTTNGVDKLAIGPGVSADQLWFQRNGNDLDISILGTTDTMHIAQWYDGISNEVNSIKLTDGQVLLASNVQQLVDAMAAFSPPPPGQTQYTSQESQVLLPIIAANWH
ncbi:MAG TPA: calcium-binding protein [Burkholderiaceae bacterium]|nr:calcium-binding protein [Burkholderiaceae bacterium]